MQQTAISGEDSTPPDSRRAARRAAQREVSREELRAHFVDGGYAASCDYPSCLFWKEQLAAFPDAKVVHSTRSPDSWVDSVLETIFVINDDNPAQPLGIRLCQLLFPIKVGRPMARMIRAVLGAQLRGDYSREGLKRTFNDWQASVVAECPKHKLLVHEAKDGWAPLCAFLGVPVPDVPYPRVNDTAEFKNILSAINAVGWVTAFLYAAAAAAAARKLLQLYA